MKRYLHVATITGKGEFPIGMLRYERASPTAEWDAYVIMNSIRQGGSKEAWKANVSKITLFSSPNWNVARWESFGVTVTPASAAREIV